MCHACIRCVTSTHVCVTHTHTVQAPLGSRTYMCECDSLYTCVMPMCDCDLLPPHTFFRRGSYVRLLKSSTLRAAHSLLPHMTCVTVTYCFHMLFFVVRRMCNFQEYRVAKTQRVPYLGRAAARRIAPTLPRAIRVGPHEGGTKFPESIHFSGVYLQYNFRGLPNYR